MSRIQVRDGFLVLMATLWCADESGVLPIFLLAAAVHECGHLFVIRLSGGTVHALCLTACGGSSDDKKDDTKDDNKTEETDAKKDDKKDEKKDEEPKA